MEILDLILISIYFSETEIHLGTKLPNFTTQHIIIFGIYFIFLSKSTSNGK
jgi:hypothetical protein